MKVCLFEEYTFKRIDFFRDVAYFFVIIPLISVIPPKNSVIAACFSKVHLTSVFTTQNTRRKAL